MMGNGDVRLAAVSPVIEGRLRQMGMTDLFELHSTADSAVQSFHRRPYSVAGMDDQPTVFVQDEVAAERGRIAVTVAASCLVCTRVLEPRSFAEARAYSRRRWGFRVRWKLPGTQGFWQARREIRHPHNPPECLQGCCPVTWMVVGIL
jgi:hypothetical protein